MLCSSTLVLQGIHISSILFTSEIILGCSPHSPLDYVYLGFEWAGHIQNSTLQDELQEQETILRQCIEQLGNSETKLAAMVSQMKEALQEQVGFRTT